MMTAPVDSRGELTRSDRVAWSREAKAHEGGWRLGFDDGRTHLFGGPRRRALAEAGVVGAVVGYLIARRGHRVFRVLVVLAALVAAVAIFPVLVALALVVGAAGYAACKGRRIPGYAYPLGLAAVILCGAAAPLSLCVTLPAGIGAVLATLKARPVSAPAELPPRTLPEAETPGGDSPF